jgi:hypothetical protein
MIRDDDVQAAFLGSSDFGDRPHAAVDRDDQPRSFAGKLQQRLFLEPIALLEAAWDESGDIGADPPKVVVRRVAVTVGVVVLHTVMRSPR